MGHPRIYPTGTTYYDNSGAWNGYTVFPSAKGALLIDMRGNEVQLWEGLLGYPSKILPGGFIMGSPEIRNTKYAHLEHIALIQVDWDGKTVWRFDKNELIEDPGDRPRYASRQHHDYQREGSPTGYYSPENSPIVHGGKTLLLTHHDVYNPRISEKPLLDDRFIEVDWEGNILWDWKANEHFEELGFDERARNALFRNPSVTYTGRGDWLHVNCVSTLGPNKWYDAGDERFHPGNIIWDARNANILAITAKKTGKIVWRIGPDFRENACAEKLGQITGQHHFHMIPRGLPGAGNLMVFNNGAFGGYGMDNGVSVSVQDNRHQDYSRVIEFNPVTLDIEWEYTAAHAGFSSKFRFYSPYVSSAQRLPNGNTLITEGSDGRIFEVTPSHRTVWEYINPYYSRFLAGVERGVNNMVYRAYRVPYEWIPQLDPPREESIRAVDVKTYRVPGSIVGENPESEAAVEGVTNTRPEASGDPAINTLPRERRKD
ncbi:MAG: aryl-sulfate sulfotransferase, partial [Synergistaceae bacterium]|nr:aryl-sulfate sulfotransferase [Synergistaceae bacterium]